MLQWNITILRVFANNQSQVAQIFFRNALGVVGWRRIAPNAADGVTNIVAIAVAAQLSGRVCQLFGTNAGDILGITFYQQGITVTEMQGGTEGDPTEPPQLDEEQLQRVLGSE